MIVKKHGSDLLLIAQTDHAKLAGQLATVWGNKQFAQPVLQEAVKLATERHDDGWADADAVPLFHPQTRRPLHFPNISVEEHIPLYRRGVLSVAEEDPYAGLLVGRHWTGQYRGRWGRQSPKEGLKGKTSDVYDLRKEVILDEEVRWAAVKHSLLTEFDRRSSWEAQLWFAYELLQVWDLLSLFVCLAPHDTDERSSVTTERTSVSLNLGNLAQPAGERLISAPMKTCENLVEMSVQVKEPGLVTIDPYPFLKHEVRVEISADAIPDQDYQDAAEVAHARANGVSKNIVCTFTNK